MQTRIENIPDELKALKQWVCWVGSDKIPKNPYTGRNAKSNDSSTWSDFETAVSAVNRFHFDGLGFMFANGYFGVDLDNCLDRIDFCDEFVETLGSYAEVSKSGTGIHIICRGKLPEGARRKGGVEMYSSGRYFICTGNIYNTQYRTVRDCTESVKILHRKYLPSNTAGSSAYDFARVEMDDQEVIDRARNCKTGSLFQMLYSGNWQGVYPSQSEADLALCNQLAFWTQKNEVQMDRIFRTSGLMRQKWDERRAGKTYGSITIAKACINCTDVYQPTQHDDTELALALFGNGKVGVEEVRKQYDMTDTGNAHRLYDRFGTIIHYSYNRRKWLFWDGKAWRIDYSGEVKKLADLICEDIKREAVLEQDEKTQVDMLRWATRTASSVGKESMIRECQHLDGVPVLPEALDAYTDFLNCQNGIVNLRNGELIPHDSNFMMSNICACDCGEVGVKPKLWLKFLDDVTNHNRELQEYIQKCVGYSLSGSNREQCAYFLYGMGNNGKSTFLDTIADMLGGYAANVQPETIMLQKSFSGGGANSDIARLKSVRFVTSEEPTEGVRLNEGLLKQITGGSKITCRFLYGEEFEYTPEFKIWVATNHKPVIRGTDFGIWRRIKLIPFEVNIKNVDKSLRYKLRKELPAILRWAVDGCIKWQREGIKEPECVLEAVKEYKHEMDLLAGFMEQCIVIDYDRQEQIMASDLFRLYSRWARENNEYELSSKMFFKEISKKLPTKGRVSAGVYFSNIRFTDYGRDLLSGGARQYRWEDFK